MKTLSVVYATRNEEENIRRSIESVKNIATEIIVVDENSTDRTKKIAENLGAKVYSTQHLEMFHITKQMAIDKARCDWVLQLDADEVVSRELEKNILEVLDDKKVIIEDNQKYQLFLRHQRLVEERDGKIGTDGDTVAYFLPRINMFLGKPLINAGVYPDGVIRLFRKDYAYLPGKSVHEQMQVKGGVGWLPGSLMHYDSPTLNRYLKRLNRYTDLQSNEFEEIDLPKNTISFIKYLLVKPVYSFLNLYFRHKGIKDGTNGFLWSFFSASHFPIAYFKYITNNKLK